ncbi:SHOCT domain-containing protein [Marinibacterium sp. SX1]|uniref:SHOCT domain-containing protein n=1 Tax=Marinibacterium sp. SX1 TaxID=3388424 RepID=UPI003D185EBA
MTNLTPEGQTIVNDVATRHGFSPDAVTHVLVALDQGGGSQAQFNHWELGGMGQWSLGGMTMIGDMFNNGLKARVDGLCAELSNTLGGARVFQPPAAWQGQGGSFQGQSQGGGQMQMQGGGGFGQSSLFVPGPGSGQWWPQDLGQPGSQGAQNDLKYAYFPAICRLAILLNGQVTVYDTGAHNIGGFGQQQSGDQSLTFTSQFGMVRVADLPVVQAADGGAPMPGPMEAAADGMAEMAPEPFQPEPPVDPGPAPQAGWQPDPVTPMTPPAAPAPGAGAVPSSDSDAIFATLEKLGALRDKGILSDEEFSAKKTELLSRL